MRIRRKIPASTLFIAIFCWSLATTSLLQAQQITYQPYVQPGDASAFGPNDQMIIAWQTNETSPRADTYTVEFGTDQSYGQTAAAQGRVVDNYLAADSSLPVPPTAPGPRVNYYALLSGLAYDTTYYYRVSGPGLPGGGFTASFRTRRQGGQFTFQVMGDEGFFPPDPMNLPYLANFEARIVHLMYNAHNLSFPDQPALPKPHLALNTGDNVYNVGSEGSYRDFWMPVWNSDSDSNESGAPFIRSIPYFRVLPIE